MLRVVYACVALLLLAPQSWAQTKSITLGTMGLIEVGKITLPGKYENLTMTEATNIKLLVSNDDKKTWTENGGIVELLKDGNFDAATTKKLAKGKWSVKAYTMVNDNKDKLESLNIVTVDVPGGVECPPCTPPCPPPLPDPPGFQVAVAELWREIVDSWNHHALKETRILTPQ